MCVPKNKFILLLFLISNILSNWALFPLLFILHPSFLFNYTLPYFMLMKPLRTCGWLNEMFLELEWWQEPHEIFCKNGVKMLTDPKDGCSGYSVQSHQWVHHVQHMANSGGLLLQSASGRTVDIFVQKSMWILWKVRCPLYRIFEILDTWFWAPGLLNTDSVWTKSHFTFRKWRSTSQRHDAEFVTQPSHMTL